MRTFHPCILSLAAVLALSILPGCETKPSFIRSDFRPDEVGRIAVLPLIVVPPLMQPPKHSDTTRTPGGCPHPKPPPLMGL